MVDIADSTAKIQAESVENGDPVSESLMSQIGGGINGLLNRMTTAEADIVSLEAVDAALSSTRLRATNFINQSVTGLSSFSSSNGGTVIAALISFEWGLASMIKLNDGFESGNVAAGNGSTASASFTSASTLRLSTGGGYTASITLLHL